MQVSIWMLSMVQLAPCYSSGNWPADDQKQMSLVGVLLKLVLRYPVLRGPVRDPAGGGPAGLLWRQKIVIIQLHR